MGVIRTALAIAVVWAHCSGAGDVVFEVGRTAVQMFYIISGFLIAHVLTSNPQYRNPLTFYANRALRIYPIYATVAILSLLIYRGGNHLFFEAYGSVPLSADLLLIATNVFILGQDWISFLTVTDGHLAFTVTSSVPLAVGMVIPQAWTLGVELCFYLLAPFVIRRPGTLMVLIGLSLLIRGVTIAMGVGLTDPWTYRFFPSELSLFLLGALSQRYLLPAWTIFIASRPTWHAPLAATVAIILGFLFYPLIPITDVVKIPLFYAGVLILIPLTFLFQNGSAADRAIGDLSYPIYICHMLCVLCIPVLLYGTPLSGSRLLCPIIIVVSILFALGLNRYVSRPVEALRHRIRSTT